MNHHFLVDYVSDCLGMLLAYSWQPQEREVLGRCGQADPKEWWDFEAAGASGRLQELGHLSGASGKPFFNKSVNE